MGAGGPKAQEVWGDYRPQAVTDAKSPVRSVPIVQIIDMMGLGGSRWAKPVLFGFDIAGGGLCQRAFVRPAPEVKDPDEVSTIFETCRSRFGTRAQISGCKFADLHWADAMTLVASGWLAQPCPFGQSGAILNADSESVNVDFRLSAVQPYKTRTCGDLKYGLANRRCVMDTPTKLPTW